MPINATKTPGGFGGDYNTPGVTFKGLSYNVRAKVVEARRNMLMGWRRGLRHLLKVGRGLDTYRDMAMEELIEELTQMIEMEDIDPDEK